MVGVAAVGPLLYFTFPAGDPAQRALFTDLYVYALPVPAGLVGAAPIL